MVGDGPRRRSLTIAGHRTSVSVEDAFWDELKTIAQRRGVSVNVLVGDIDRQRDANLSSAIRLFVLASLKSRNGTD